MRPIKFRFWGGQKMFHDLDNVMECLKQQLAFDQNVLGLIQYDHVGLHKSAFMQFTGLQDKNGKDIYEGDIVTMHQFLFDGNEVENQLTGVVEYLEAEFGLAKIKSSYWEQQTGYAAGEGVNPLCNFYGLHEESFEVIGNICEHPQLLNSEQEDNRSVATKLPNEPEGDKQK